jgi:hypothetical protein
MLNCTDLSAIGKRDREWYKKAEIQIMKTFLHTEWDNSHSMGQGIKKAVIEYTITA